MSSSSVLIICTSHDTLGETGFPTGVWSTEGRRGGGKGSCDDERGRGSFFACTDDELIFFHLLLAIHPYHIFKSAGFNVVFASPKGGAIPLDPYSDPRAPVSMVKNDTVVDHFLADAEAQKLFQNSIPTASIKASEYMAAFVAGGNGALFDLPSDDGTRAILQHFVRSGGAFGAVCHGSAALLPLRSANNDFESYVKGKRCVGFTNQEEDIAGAQIGVKYLPFYLETELRKLGAKFEHGPPFGVFTTVDDGGRFVCGQQNFSGGAAAELVVTHLLRTQRFASITWAPAPVTPSSLHGSWTSGALERVYKKDGRLLFRRRTFRITSNNNNNNSSSYELLCDVFADQKGSQPVFSLFFEGPFEIIGASAVAPGATESNWSHKRWFMVPQSQHFIDNVLSKDPRTSPFAWEVGVPIDVSEHGAIDVPSLAEGTTEYDIIAVSQDGAIMTFGTRGFEPPMQISQRHTILSPDVFVRISDFDACVANSLRPSTSKNARHIAIIGGGRVGKALAPVLSRAGHQVTIASRSSPVTPAAAVAAAQVVVLALPGEEVAPLLASLAAALSGKVVLDATNPIGIDAAKRPDVQLLVPAAQAVFKVFNTIGSGSLSEPMFGTIRKDMFFCGNAQGEPREWVSRLIESIGFAPVDLGGWEHARHQEAIADLWIHSALVLKRGVGISWKLLRK